MIDILQETLLTFPQAAHRLPGRRHVATLHRWRLTGINGIKLETCLVGGRRYTSVEALQRFVERMSASGAAEPPSLPTPKQRQQAVDAVERELDAAGIR